MLLPKEHGAYGQLVFPLGTAWLVTGVTLPSALLGTAVVSAFLAHEPLAVVLSLRGPRARREHAREALAWLVIFGGLCLAAGVAAVATMPSRPWAVAIPAGPALALLMATWSGQEKTLAGEVLAASAFSLVTVAIAAANGAPTVTGALLAGAFLVNLVLATLAVRSVIARVRRGGDAAAATRLALAVWILELFVLSGLVAGIAWFGLTGAAATAFVPGMVAPACLVLYPPPPSRLKAVGWSLVASSALTAALLVAFV